MKKLVLFCAIISLFLAACINEQAVEQPQELGSPHKFVGEQESDIPVHYNLTRYWFRGKHYIEVDENSAEYSDGKIQSFQHYSSANQGVGINVRNSTDCHRVNDAWFNCSMSFYNYSGNSQTRMLELTAINSTYLTTTDDISHQVKLFSLSYATFRTLAPINTEGCVSLPPNCPYDSAAATRELCVNGSVTELTNDCGFVQMYHNIESWTLQDLS